MNILYRFIVYLPNVARSTLPEDNTSISAIDQSAAYGICKKIKETYDVNVTKYWIWHIAYDAKADCVVADVKSREFLYDNVQINETKKPLLIERLCTACPNKIGCDTCHRVGVGNSKSYTVITRIVTWVEQPCNKRKKRYESDEAVVVRNLPPNLYKWLHTTFHAYMKEPIEAEFKMPFGIAIKAVAEYLENSERINVKGLLPVDIYDGVVRYNRHRFSAEYRGVCGRKGRYKPSRQ